MLPKTSIRFNLSRQIFMALCSYRRLFHEKRSSSLIGGRMAQN
jgi:hypothetical protein